MNKEKQIEEMANDLRKSEFWYFDDTDCDFELERKKTAENLYNAGYRKASEVAREIFEEIEASAKVKYWRGGGLVVFEVNGEDFAELKKKYTKGGKEQDGKTGKKNGGGQKLRRGRYELS